MAMLYKDNVADTSRSAIALVQDTGVWTSIKGYLCTRKHTQLHYITARTHRHYDHSTKWTCVSAMTRRWRL